MIKPFITCLMGPTASGKTDISLDLCDHFPFEIISVDSAMVYRGLDIGAAKPDKTILEKYPHHLIDICDPETPYSAADFVKDATGLIKDIIARGKCPLLVGGTMLYFKALQFGLNKLPPADNKTRESLIQLKEEKGVYYLYQWLQKEDPVTAERLHPHDNQRIQRALEIYLMTGKPMSDLIKTKVTSCLPYSMLNIGLFPNDRAQLHDRIERRFKQMLSMGFIDEVQALINQGINLDSPAMRSVGYRQAIRYLSNEINKETFIAQSISATRQLAKRQLTWLRSWPKIEYFEPMDRDLLNNLYHFLMNHLKKSHR